MTGFLQLKVIWLGSSVGRALVWILSFSLLFLPKYTDPGSNPLEGMAGGHFDLIKSQHFDLYHSFIYRRLVNFSLMNECLKVEEVGLIVSQTCEKKNM